MRFQGPAAEDCEVSHEARGAAAPSDRPVEKAGGTANSSRTIVGENRLLAPRHAGAVLDPDGPTAVASRVVEPRPAARNRRAARRVQSAAVEGGRFLANMVHPTQDTVEPLDA